MIETDKIQNDDYAFYIGGQDTCASCMIRKYEISKIECLLPEYKFYEMNASSCREFLREQMILKIPFFMITFKGKIEDIFYTYDSITTLYLRLKEKVARR